MVFDIVMKAYDAFQKYVTQGSRGNGDFPKNSAEFRATSFFNKKMKVIIESLQKGGCAESVGVF